MTGGFVFAIVLSVVAVAMLVLRGVQVSRVTQRLQGSGQPVPRAVPVFWVLAVIAVIVVASTWIFVLAG